MKNGQGLGGGAAPTERDGSSGCGSGPRQPPQRLRPRPGAERRDGMSRLPPDSLPPPRLPPPAAPLRNYAFRSLRGGRRAGSVGQGAVREGATERRGAGAHRGSGAGGERKAGVRALGGCSAEEGEDTDAGRPVSAVTGREDPARRHLLPPPADWRPLEKSAGSRLLRRRTSGSAPPWLSLCRGIPESIALGN